MLPIANIGPADLAVVFIVALLVFGPKKLPEVGRQVGLAMREIRKLSNEFLGSINGIQSEVHDTARTLNPFSVADSKTVTETKPSKPATVEPQTSPSVRRRGLTLSTLPSDSEASGEESK
jgi:TatA/E family protein of Tat protein translocase